MKAFLKHLAPPCGLGAHQGSEAPLLWANRWPNPLVYHCGTGSERGADAVAHEGTILNRQRCGYRQSGDKKSVKVEPGVLHIG